MKKNIVAATVTQVYGEWSGECLFNINGVQVTTKLPREIVQKIVATLEQVTK